MKTTPDQISGEATCELIKKVQPIGTAVRFLLDAILKSSYEESVLQNITIKDWDISLRET